MKVLYVEDNDQDADLTRRHLSRLAPHIVLMNVADVASARERLKADVLPDLLLCDMNLPDGSGLELLRQVRDQALPMPVVMLTGSGDEATVVAALRGGADDYIVKHGNYLDRLPVLLDLAMGRHRLASARHARPIRVLYAERTHTDVDLLMRHLNRYAPNIRLEAVGSADEVLNRLPPIARAAAAPDVLLLDYLLPGMNALELVKVVRQDRGLDLPVIIITGQGDEDSAVQTLKLGATDYLVKHEDMLRRLPVAIESAFFRVELERERGALRESQARFRQMAEGIGDVFFLNDPLRRKLLYVSPAFERIWGLPCEVLYDDWVAWMAPIHPHDQVRMQAAVQAINTDERFEAEYRVVRPDGALRHVLMRSYPVFDEAGLPYRRAGIVQDITERKQQEARIEHLAYHDPLTGLPNRTLLMDRLGLALAHAQRHQGQLAVLFMDLDRFKTINDTLGHLQGDELLKQVSQRLRGVLREDDTVARLGGDEFVVVLPQVEGVADPAHVADKLMAALTASFRIGHQDLYVTCSLGVSMYPRDGTDAETLLKYADTALYKAKDAGRNAYRFFSPEMDARAHQRLRLENDLRGAIARDELRLHYQPKLRVDNGQVSGVEALVRWMHPVEGLIPPDQFIPLAEETGLILDIGEWVLGEACRQLRRWRAAGHPDLCMAVNLSPRQLQRPGLDVTVLNALEAGGLPPASLELEITESSVMQEPEQALTLLRRLRAIGVRISIDDFGTGYTNFAYLRQLPLQRLKIDRSFIQHLADVDEDGVAPGATQDDVAIVEAIIAMAHKLRLNVLAEGVETEAQHERLSGLGCDEMQGFLHGRPMPADECERWMLDRLKKV
ncbi:two-component system response regulator [Ideonella margarita]|uniref:EAL domain-containing protein n=1 Tax=Ideonella margarita TaxID=2984191 RepID=A0ABU9C1J0_9BURK